jgi:hypothetical protein
VEEHHVDVGAGAELAPGVRPERDDRGAPGEFESRDDAAARVVERLRQGTAVPGAAQARIGVDPGPRGAQQCRGRGRVARGRPGPPRPCGSG